jgi:hypothetical protein
MNYKGLLPMLYTCAVFYSSILFRDVLCVVLCGTCGTSWNTRDLFYSGVPPSRVEHTSLVDIG